MKKIILLSIFMLGLFVLDQVISAQAVPATATWVNNIGRAKTTSTNADTAIAPIKLVGFFNIVTVEVAITKISGTAAGKVYLQGSLDNANFDNIDSLTLSDKTVNYKHFKLTSSPYYYYQLYYRPSGTQSSTMVGRYIARKEFGQ